MLELKGIVKDYTAGDTVVHALKGVDLSFRKSEFVSILGPSGCGKTTMLNIIGGLDHYSDGELFIDGVSTKNYTARDWDTYRNHRIGFVFQSYNLIPHQTILENVELALNISGVAKQERVQRAKDALDKVGLQGQYHKKPNQLSGGQCQRVAIARALVNDPEILLADEPTGALDTVTSTQIMDLIKEVAKECLVIMVTHNPELAEQYSSRIIRFLDGEVVSDTDPFDGNETAENVAKDEITAEEKPQEQATQDNAAEGEIPQEKKTKDVSKKSKLSFWSAFRLSARNLRSKFKRSFLVCLAGSIGIIGVALVLAVSAGVQGYIRDMQEDMLSGNPVTISETTMDMSGLLNASNNIEKFKAAQNGIKDGEVNIELMVEFLVNRSKDMQNIMVSNDITAEYVKFVESLPKEHYAAITKNYGINLSNNLYTDFSFEGEGGEMQSRKMSLTAATETYTSMLKDIPDYKEFATYIGMVSNSFAMAPDNDDFILSQYDIISGSGSHVATKANEIMIVVDEETMLTDLMLAQFGYLNQKEFFNIVYRAMKNALEDPTATDRYDESVWKECLTYEELLGKTFTWYPNDTVFAPRADDPIPNSPVQPAPFAYQAYADNSWTTGKDLTVTAILRPKKGTKYGCLDSGFYYTAALTEEILKDSAASAITAYAIEKGGTITTLQSDGGIVGLDYQLDYTFEGKPHTPTVCLGSGNTIGQLFSSIFGGGSSSPSVQMEYYTLSIRDLGGLDLPSSIRIYPVNFNHKDNITDYLAQWNTDADITVDDKVLTAEDRSKITITDNLALIISLINSLIQMITVALVAFTSLSLVVSTVMVAIITYVSVMERIKEIGVIRSLGGRKRDVSNLFIAETFIIGGLAGVIGIVITYILSAIVNVIVKHVAGIATIASLSPLVAIIMILLSIGLTLISGLVPASAAAKKDPVDALRTE